MQIVQWFQDPYWTQNVVLGDRSYVISSKFNTRDLSWYVTIATSNGVNIISNKRVTLNNDIIEGSKSELKPDGILLVVPMTENIEVITRDNMGTDVQLVFIGNDEIL